MKGILSLARQCVLRSLDRLFRSRLRRSNNPEKWIKEFKLLSGRGRTRGRRFDRHEAHER